MIKSFVVKSIEELFHNLNSLPNHFAYRGQANAEWKIQSALERVLGDEWSPIRARTFEDYSLDAFKSKYHIYNNGNEHTPKSKLAWLSVMQHYGVPTRLIDFTTSPYTALYFALETYDVLSKNNLAVYAFDYTDIMEKSISLIKSRHAKFNETRHSISKKPDEVFDEIVDVHSYDIAWITEPCELNARIDRQAGTFLISGNLERPIESVLSESIYDESSMHKIIIPFQFLEGIFVGLRKMNINSKTIYGDLGGLAKSIRMELQQYN